MTLRSMELNKLHQLKQKVRLLSDDISFLKKCKKNKFFPNFIQISIPIQNSVTEKVLHNAKINWLNLEIKYLYAKQSNLELQAMEKHLFITKTLNFVYFPLFDEKYQSILTSIEFKHQQKERKLNKKFNDLMNDKFPKSIQDNRNNENQNLVLNLSSESFSSQELELLSKGLNYSIKPNHELETIFVDIETNILHLKEDKKTAIRLDLINNIKNESNKNINYDNYKYKNELRMLKNMKEKDVFFMKADKSNTVVILSKLDYNNRVLDMIQDGPYIICEKNPLNKFINQVSSTMKECKTLLNKETTRKLTVPNPILPKLYCLPKIHKPGNKMRPIVSCVNCPTYLISKFLVNKLQSFTQPEGFSIKDRYDFINKIKTTTLTQDEYLISFDVTGLYPNVPIKETMNIIKEWLFKLQLQTKEIQEYMLLINLCMSQTTFQFNESFYCQTEGTAMGNPLSCLIANIFMSKFETEAKNKMSYFPRIWIRYVDDIFAVFDKKENFNLFLNTLNSFYPTINFTYEIEENNCLPFLDILILKNENTGSLSFDIYRKPTQIDRYIINSSFHPPNQKRSVFNALIHRLLSTPLSEENYKKEISKIKNVATFNGYSSKLIDSIIKKKKKRIETNSRTTLTKNGETKTFEWKSFTHTSKSKEIQKIFKKHTNYNISFKPKLKLKTILGNPKPKTNDEDKSGIYQIHCDSCENSYIGQTKRKLKTRFKEHKANFKYGQLQKSAIAKHAIENNHNFSNIKLLQEVQNPKNLDAVETLQMKKHEEHLVNTEAAPLNFSPLLYIL